MLHSWRRLDCVSRCAYGCWIMARSSGVKGNKKWSKPDWHRHFHRTNNYFCSTHYARGKHLATMRGSIKEDNQVTLSHPVDDVWPANIIEGTSHRDGSLYKNDFGYLRLCRITDRNETRLEPMTFSEPMDCQPDRERCMVHHSTRMMQIFSIKLAQIPIDTESVELYGYIAVRDSYDSLLNYIVNRSRDGPIVVKQGSLIEMTGPKRGIRMCSSVLFEVDMRIKKGEQEEDDLQLIDGAIDYSELTAPWGPFTNRINGDCGAVDITLALVEVAVEATIEVIISKVDYGFSLSLSSYVFLCGLHHKIQLFDGTIGESRSLRRYMVAVRRDTSMHLKFRICQKGSKNDLERYCSFEANTHGCASQQIMIELASISVKVTWSTIPL